MLCLHSDKGLHVEDSLVIDPARKKSSEFFAISHAHSDHVNLASAGKCIASPETIELVEAGYGKLRQPMPLSFGKKLPLGDFSLSLHNAGHILGSSQFLIENESSLAVTSDFKLQDSMIHKGAEILNAEILVIDSTFGLPAYSFPEREKIYEEMASWAKEQILQKKLIVFAGYSLGKAQELTAFCNEFLGIAPLVHEKIFEFNNAYKRLGVNLGDYIRLDHNLSASDIIIVPPSLVSNNLIQALNFSSHKQIASAFATGWNYKSYYDRVFPLSDHADFNQLIQYIEQSKPKLVLTQYGFEKEFASFVKRRLKIPARPLSELKKGQKMLMEFA